MRRNHFFCLLTWQQGAMFGLDARIALGIFGALSVIAGAYTAMNMSKIHANSFSKELQETAQAIEAIHNDLRADVHSNLIDNTDTHAYIALYDDFVLDENIRGRWLGPYITTSVPVHPKYGEVRIQKRARLVQQDCTPGETCFLWLNYDDVPLQVAEALNAIFDGQSEMEPSLAGRVQWQGGHDDRHVILAFRTSRALGGAAYF